MAISESVLIIIIVCALVVALLLTIGMSIYFCYFRRRAIRHQQHLQHHMESPHHTNTHTHTTILPRNDVSTGDGRKMRLDKLPTAAQTKRMEEGQTFTGESQMNGTTHNDDDTPTFIMGPTSELSSRPDGGVENDGFMKDNQFESAAYLRGGVDPADVAEVYMEDDVLQEAARARRKQQLEVRRKTASKNNSKKKAAAQRNLQDTRKNSADPKRERDRDKDRDRNGSRHGHRGSEKHRQSRS